MIAYDAVNHGSSTHHPEMSYINMAHDLINLMEKLKIEKSLLIGINDWCFMFVCVFLLCFVLLMEETKRTPIAYQS